MSKDEQKSIFVKELSARNAESAMEGFRLVDGRISMINAIMVDMQRQLGNQAVRISELETQITTYKAMSTGHGPTG